MKYQNKILNVKLFHISIFFDKILGNYINTIFNYY